MAWNRTWTGDPNDIIHSASKYSDGNAWDWMNISKKEARKMSSSNWVKRFGEAGLYESDNNRSEVIDRSAWKDLGWKRKGDKWKADKKTKEKTWKLYGELTGMTRFSDIDKDNYKDIDWRAKFKDRDGAWTNALETEWGDLNEEEKWAKYSEIKEEVPEDYDDVAGKDAKEELQRMVDLGPMPGLHDFGPEPPDFERDPEGGHDYDYGGSMFDDAEGNPSDELRDEYKPTAIGSLEDVIKEQMGKDHRDHPDFPADPGEHWWDPTAGEDGQGAYRNAEGQVTDRPDVDPRDPESVTGDDAIGLPKPGLIDTDMDGELDSHTEQLSEGVNLPDKGVIETSSGIDTPEDVSDVTHDTTTNLTDAIDKGASTTAELGQSGQAAITQSSTEYDDFITKGPTPTSNDPRAQPDPSDATAWQGAGAQARTKGLGTEFGKYDTLPKTGTNAQITSALGSRLKRSQASKTGRNTTGTGAFKFRNPLSIN